MVRKTQEYEDSPELTAADFRRARPMKDVMPEAVEALKRGPGRPALGEAAKQRVSLRLDRAVIEAYRATGAGWQARVNATLERHKPRAKQTRARS